MGLSCKQTSPADSNSGWFVMTEEATHVHHRMPAADFGQIEQSNRTRFSVGITWLHVTRTEEFLNSDPLRDV